MNSRIRILFIIDFIYTLAGGTENQLLKIINNLDKKKYQLHLLSLRNTAWIQENKSEIHCPIKTYNIIRLKNPLNWVKFILIIFFIRRLCPDMVMTFFPLSNIVGVLLSRIAGVRTIVSTRRDFGLWLQKRGLFLLRFANSFVSKIITNSQIVKNLTCNEERVESDRIDVLYNGIELVDIKPYVEEGLSLKRKLGIPEDVLVIGTIAGLKPMKRHSIIIEAFRYMLDERKDIHLIIVGDGPLMKELRVLTRELQIENFVHFVGSKDNVLPYLSIFDIGVNSSANEGLSNAIMEYMAYGVPCIVSNAGGNRELVEDGITGFVFELDNAKELTSKALVLLEDQTMQRRFALAAKEKMINNFTVKEMINRYDEYLTGLVRNSRL